MEELHIVLSRHAPSKRVLWLKPDEVTLYVHTLMGWRPLQATIFQKIVNKSDSDDSAIKAVVESNYQELSSTIVSNYNELKSAIAAISGTITTGEGVSDFPETGNKAVIYFDTAGGVLYRWDEESASYVSLTSGEGSSVVIESISDEDIKALFE